MTNRVWIDTDMGFDDLAAVLTVMHAPGWTVAGMSLVAGNGPVSVVTDNAARAATFFGWQFPIHVGSDAPIVGPLVTAQAVLGDDAMASAGRSLPLARASLSEVDGVSALVAWLEDFHGADAAPDPCRGATVLALGPLTNIARALQRRPDLAPKIGMLMWMGGSVGPGNHTAAAEFNAAVDPEAINVVLDAGVTLHMVGLDACRQARTTVADSEALRATGTDKGEVLADLLLGYVRIARGHVGAVGVLPMPLYDPTAAAALVSPGSVSFVPARVVAECDGRHTRGATVVEFRVPRKAAPNAMVATTVDEARVRNAVLGALRRAALATP